MPPPGRLLDIGGRRLHVDIVGHGPAQVVLEAGLAATSVSWALVTKRVAEFATVITYDRAGLGWSDPAPSGYTALDAARDLATLLDRTERHGPLLFVGHSFGGLIVRVLSNSTRSASRHSCWSIPSVAQNGVLRTKSVERHSRTASFCRGAVSYSPASVS